MCGTVTTMYAIYSQLQGDPEQEIRKMLQAKFHIHFKLACWTTSQQSQQSYLSSRRCKCYKRRPSACTQVARTGVLQLASLGWDLKTRSKFASICGKERSEGFCNMVPCHYNPAYRQLASHYPEELSSIFRTTTSRV